MQYRNTHEFPQWVKDFNYWGYCKKWPKEWQPIADAIYERAGEMAKKWRKKNVDICPISSFELNNYMGADIDNYESYPIFCCNEGFRPDEWDYLHDSYEARDSSRSGDLHEIKIGNWYFICGFDFD